MPHTPAHPRYYTVISHALGGVVLEGSATHLEYVYCRDTSRIARSRMAAAQEVSPSAAQAPVWMEEAVAKVTAFLRGEPVDVCTIAHRVPCGTAFQRRVWQALQAIPRAQVRSYAQVAECIGMPKAVRAVANACGANPLPLLIPCHRVVRHDGSLGGFGWGRDWKRHLLIQES